MSKPIIAVIGRPNVGKSTLFNILAKERISIVDSTPGVTRDRVYAEIEWLNRSFVFIDTGGIEPKTDDVLLKQMRIQAELAIDMADVILFVVDKKAGLHSADQDIAGMLRKSKKPIVVAVNKCDHVGGMPDDAYEFYNLGLGEIYPISAVHALGLGELLDAITEHLNLLDYEEEENPPIKVAIVGKPNSGKSSLANRLVGNNRSIVSDIPGTTRDAVDSFIESDEGNFVIIDTAGLRKKSKIEDQIERYSVIRTLAAVERADVCLILIDATEGVTEQDTKIAGFVHGAGKAAIFVVNKWDLMEKETGTLENYKKDVKARFGYMQYAPVLFISALTGQRSNKVLSMVNDAFAQANKRITTGVLNEVISEAQTLVPAPQDKGRRLKIQYVTQVGVMPPTFILFTNDKELMHFSYERYLENQMRKNFGFVGTPIRFILRSREKKK